MNRRQLEQVIRAAAATADVRDIVVIGSQAVLGSYPGAPASAENTGWADNNGSRDAPTSGPPGPAGEVSDCRVIMYHQLTDRFIVAADLQTTWRFFSSAENLPRITPPWLSFRIDTPAPVHIEADSLLDYTIRWLGLPIRWRTKIIDWSPPRQFIDLQVKGPYALWHHQHTFAQTDGGTECSDRVIYQLPVPGVRRIVHAVAVKKQLLGIFSFRREVIARELGWVRAVQQDVLIAGL